ncbi:unnamed protein product, partial [Ectocarpus fasciculatus]
QGGTRFSCITTDEDREGEGHQLAPVAGPATESSGQEGGIPRNHPGNTSQGVRGQSGETSFRPRRPKRPDASDHLAGRGEELIRRVERH